MGKIEEAEWIEFSEGNFVEGSYKICSKCKSVAPWTWTRGDQILSPYCPWCGSKMKIYKK